MSKKILITGATGFIGKNLCSFLKKKKYKLRAFVRNRNKFNIKSIDVFEGDLINKKDIDHALKNIDIAYYLVHSMKDSKNFEKIERMCAKNFSDACSKNKVKRIIYLSGIINSKNRLSKHLKSRKNIGDILRTSKSKVTELRASIIIGEDSFPFKIIKKIVEKLQIIIWPTWANKYCQPSALQDVIYYLEGCIKKEETKGKIYDIGGKGILKYKELLLLYSRKINKKIIIIEVPAIPSIFLSYGAHLITRQSLNLIIPLFESLKYNSICKNNKIRKILTKTPLSYKKAIRLNQRK